MFGDDVRVLAFPMEYDEIFVGVAIALIVLFALETIMSCFAKGRKYVFGFYFWLDFIACLSLFMDVPEFMAFIGMDPCEGTDSYGTGLEGEEYDERYGTKSENSGDIARAGRASRAGTRAEDSFAAFDWFESWSCTLLCNRRRTQKSKRNDALQSLEVLWFHRHHYQSIIETWKKKCCKCVNLLYNR